VTWHPICQTPDHVIVIMDSVISVKIVSNLILVINLFVTQVISEEPWSPIVGDNPIIPFISTSNLLIHSAPLLKTSETHMPLTIPYKSNHEESYYNRRLTPSSKRRRDFPFRRNYRRRRRYWRHPRSSYRRVRSHSYFSSPVPSPSYLKHVWSEAEGRTRARVAREREDSEGRGFVRSVRNLFGAPEHCLEGGRQYSCTFAPVCWMTGGVATPGCDSFLYSCCKPPNLGTSRKEKDLFEKRKQDFLDHEPECGVSRHRQFSKRIIGGEKAKFSELPWQAHIRISSYQCGGVLLNHWYIATAAHCVHRAKLNKISVILGEFDTKDGEEEPLDSETFKVDHIIIHPDFRYMLTQPDRFDVALLHLDRPVFYQDNIIPICLPPPDIHLTGKVGLVAGWGKTDNSFGKTGTNILHKVLVPIIKNDECIRWHEDKNILVQLHDEMFCAGHKRGKMDACLGDSGGPLIIHYNGRWTLIGVTSAGFGCAVDKQPGIYHKIGKTVGWIRNQISP